MSFNSLKKRLDILERKKFNIKSLDLKKNDIIYNGKSIYPAPLRIYQKKLFDDIVYGKTRKAFYMLPRRSGKDFTFFRILVHLCLLNKNTNAVYLFPDLQMARKIIWDGIFIFNGKNTRYIDLLPREICTLNNTVMRIVFNNGSSIQLMGTLDTAKLRGITSSIIIASEYCFMSPDVLPIISPIVSASDGILLLNSTPNGLNYAHHQFQQFSKDQSWLTIKETVETLIDENGRRYIGDSVVQDSRSNGLTESEILREYYCECVPDESKVIYARELKELKILENVYHPGIEVHFSFDLGLLDYTSIVAFQIMPNGMPSVIWCFQDNNQPWIYYYNTIKSKMTNKRIGKFILPHDSAKRNASSITLNTIAQDFIDMGADVLQLKKPKSLDGLISLTKSYMAGMLIDSSCSELIEALNQYQKDDNNRPIHDQYSHYASAFSYMCMAIYEGIYENKQQNIIRYKL